jgi:hypothetical protein
MKVFTKNSVNTNENNEPINPHISPNKAYHVIGFDDENFRIMNDLNEPVLYPKYLFNVIDSVLPTDWIKTSYDEGEYFVNPLELSEPGFYEDYFDGVPDAVEKFLSYLYSHGILNRKAD